MAERAIYVGRVYLVDDAQPHWGRQPPTSLRPLARERYVSVFNAAIEEALAEYDLSDERERARHEVVRVPGSAYQEGAEAMDEGF